MIIGIIISIIVVLMVGLLFASYVKCPPDRVYLITGIKRQPRIIVGKASLRIPFFERVDKLTLELIQIDVKTTEVPTLDFINVTVDAVANVRVPNEEELIKVASRHFLNQSPEYIAKNIQQVLEGNMREIIGQMNLVDVVNNKKMFSDKIQENASDDIRNIGLEIVNLNVQTCTDENNAIVDLGIDNLVKIQKTARISKAQAEKEIKIAEADAEEQGAKAEAEANAKIAEQRKILEIKKAQFKTEEDKARAEADAAYEIQKSEQQKTINETAVQAEIKRTEKTTELKEKEVMLKEKELDANIRKQADAEKYAMEINAQAQKEVEIQKAQAKTETSKLEAQAIIEIAKAEKQAKEFEAQGLKANLLAEADGIKAKLLAEAEGIKAKALAEAEGIEKKAEAQAKMKDASIVEMVCNTLPEIAKEVSAPLSQIGEITMYGDQSTEMLSNNTQKIDKIMNIAQDALGLDIKAILNNLTNKEQQSDERV